MKEPCTELRPSSTCPLVGSVLQLLQISAAFDLKQLKNLVFTVCSHIQCAVSGSFMDFLVMRDLFLQRSVKLKNEQLWEKN